MIVNGDLTAAGATVLTVPSGKKYAISLIAFYNYDTNAHTVELNLLDSGASASNSNRLVRTTLNNDDTLQAIDKTIYLGEGQSIYVKCDADTTVNYHISYVEVE